MTIKTPFETLLDSPELAEVLALPEIAPGCNLPSIPHSPEHPGLWSQHIEATATGLTSALGGEESRKSDDRFQHLVCFPSWSKGEIAFFKVQPGAKIVVEAASDSTLKVVGEGFEVEFPEKIVVLYHGSLSGEAVKAYYSEG